MKSSTLKRFLVKIIPLYSQESNDTGNIKTYTKEEMIEYYSVKEKL